MPTPLDVITDSYQEIGVLGEGDTPSAGQQDFALRHINRLIDWLATKGLTVTGLLRTTKALTSGTASYTIGTGGSVNIVRPVSIAFAGVLLDNTAADPIERRIAVYSDQDWANVRLKDFDATPLQGIYYDRTLTTVGSALSTIYPWPVPDVATTTLVLYTAKAFAKLVQANLSTTHEFAPGLESVLMYHLAKRLAPGFGKAISSDLERFADDSLKQVEDVNRQPTVLALDPSLPGVSRGEYDVNSDEYR